MTTIHPDRAAAADAALAAPLDLTGATVVTAGSAAKVVVSTRIDPTHSAWILTEAGAGGTTPSALVAELIGEAIAARIAAGGAPTVRRRVVDLDAVHRAIDALGVAA